LDLCGSRSFFKEIRFRYPRQQRLPPRALRIHAEPWPSRVRGHSVPPKTGDPHAQGGLPSKVALLDVRSTP
jgi:hypothetical protein